MVFLEPASEPQIITADSFSSWLQKLPESRRNEPFDVTCFGQVFFCLSRQHFRSEKCEFLCRIHAYYFTKLLRNKSSESYLYYIYIGIHFEEILQMCGNTTKLYIYIYIYIYLVRSSPSSKYLNVASTYDAKFRQSFSEMVTRNDIANLSGSCIMEPVVKVISNCHRTLTLHSLQSFLGVIRNNAIRTSHQRTRWAL